LICDFCFGEFLHHLQQSFCASSGKTSLCLLYSIPSMRFLDQWPEKESYWMRACWGWRMEPMEKSTLYSVQPVCKWKSYPDLVRLWHRPMLSRDTPIQTERRDFWVFWGQQHEDIHIAFDLYYFFDNWLCQCLFAIIVALCSEYLSWPFYRSVYWFDICHAVDLSRSCLLLPLLGWPFQIFRPSSVDCGARFC
jgi:hypothetical protein